MHDCAPGVDQGKHLRPPPPPWVGGYSRARRICLGLVHTALSSYAKAIEQPVSLNLSTRVLGAAFKLRGGKAPDSSACRSSVSISCSLPVASAAPIHSQHTARVSCAHHLAPRAVVAEVAAALRHPLLCIMSTAAPPV